MTDPLHRELDRLDLDLQVAAALLRFEQKFPEILSEEEGRRNAHAPELQAAMRETYDACQSWTPPQPPSIWWPIFFSSVGITGLVMAFYGVWELAR